MAANVRGATFIVGLFLAIVLGSIFFAEFPVYPRISITATAQTTDPRFFLGGVNQDRLTVFQAASIQKGQIFLYPVSFTSSSLTVSLGVIIYDSLGNQLAQKSWANQQLGTYLFTVIPQAQLAQNVTYRFQLTASFSDGVSIVIMGYTPPS